MVKLYDEKAQVRSWESYEVYYKRLRGNPKNILDIGCGLGYLMEAIKNNGANAVGIENDDEAIEICLEKGLEVIKHNIEEPLSMFEDECFDAVICNQVLELFYHNQQMSILKEAFRILCPGGQLLVMSPCRHWERARVDSCNICLLTPSELMGLVKKVGFTTPNMGYNRSQPFNGVPYEVAQEIWRKYKPDLLSKDATVLTYKPLW